MNSTRRLEDGQEGDEGAAAVAGVPTVVRNTQVNAASLWTVPSCSGACFDRLAPDNSHFVVSSVCLPRSSVTPPLRLSSRIH